MLNHNDYKSSSNTRCRVCGGDASGFHYGVDSCEGCKGFFRRCLTQGLNNKCTNDEMCVITPLSRNSCQFCRLKKCKTVGMSKEGSRLGRRPKRLKQYYNEHLPIYTPPQPNQHSQQNYPLSNRQHIQPSTQKSLQQQLLLQQQTTTRLKESTTHLPTQQQNHLLLNESFNISYNKHNLTFDAFNHTNYTNQLNHINQPIHSNHTNQLNHNEHINQLNHINPTTNNNVRPNEFSHFTSANLFLKSDPLFTFSNSSSNHHSLNFLPPFKRDPDVIFPQPPPPPSSPPPPPSPPSSSCHFFHTSASASSTHPLTFQIIKKSQNPLSETNFKPSNINLEMNKLLTSSVTLQPPPSNDLDQKRIKQEISLKSAWDNKTFKKDFLNNNLNNNLDNNLNNNLNNNLSNSLNNNFNNNFINHTTTLINNNLNNNLNNNTTTLLKNLSNNLNNKQSKFKVCYSSSQKPIEIRNPSDNPGSNPPCDNQVSLLHNPWQRPIGLCLQGVRGPYTRQDFEVINNVISKVARAYELTCVFTWEKYLLTLEKYNSTKNLQPVLLTPDYVWSKFVTNMTTVIQRVVRFCKRLPGFRELSQEDQIILIKQGSFEVIHTRYAKLIQEQAMFVPDMSLLVPISVIEKTPLGDFFVQEWKFALVFNRLSLTDGEMALLNAITIVWPDRAGLESRKKVEVMNLRFLQALYLHMKRTRPDTYEEVFNKTISMIPYIRDISRMHSRKVFSIRKNNNNNNNHNNNNKDNNNKDNHNYNNNKDNHNKDNHNKDNHNKDNHNNNKDNNNKDHNNKDHNNKDNNNKDHNNKDHNKGKKKQNITTIYKNDDDDVCGDKIDDDVCGDKIDDDVCGDKIDDDKGDDKSCDDGISFVKKDKKDDIHLEDNDNDDDGGGDGGGDKKDDEDDGSGEGGRDKKDDEDDGDKDGGRGGNENNGGICGEDGGDNKDSNCKIHKNGVKKDSDMKMKDDEQNLLFKRQADDSVDNLEEKAILEKRELNDNDITTTEDSNNHHNIQFPPLHQEVFDKLLHD